MMLQSWFTVKLQPSSNVSQRISFFFLFSDFLLFHCLVLLFWCFIWGPPANVFQIHETETCYFYTLFSWYAEEVCLVGWWSVLFRIFLFENMKHCNICSKYYFCTCSYRNNATIEKTFVLIIGDKRNRIHTTSRIMNMQTGNAKTRIWHPRHSETDTQLPGTVILKKKKKNQLNGVARKHEAKRKKKHRHGT